MRQVVRRVRKEDNITIVDHLDPLSWFVGIRDYVDAFIGMRLHSVIFASEAKKPILCLPYERKVWEFIKNKNEITVMPLDKIKSSAFVDFVEAQLEQVIPGKLV